MEKESRRARSVSEPALRLNCGGISRERRRESEVSYETGRDRAALSLSRWSAEEVCAVLYYLVCRCSQPQLDALHTSLESVPHRDLQLSTVGVASSMELHPVSTALSREVRVRLRKSRRPQNRRLYRAQSVVVHEELPIRPLTVSPLTPHSRESQVLPWLTCSQPASRCCSQAASHCATAPANHDSFTFRKPTTPRRHLLATPIYCDLLTPNLRSFVNEGASPQPQVWSEATHFLTWFSGLTAGWQKQEVLQMIVTSLDPSQLYYLSTLLLLRRYKDPVSCLPEPLALHLLSFVPPKDLLRSCTTVSRAWHERCTSEKLWHRLCSLTRLGVPRLRGGVSWRSLFMDGLQMRSNWWRGRCEVTTSPGHTGRVLCVRVRGSLVATGSSDATIRIWNLENGACVQVLSGHSKGVWSLTFYGKRLLISGSSDQTVKVWNIETGVCQRTARGVHSGTIWSLQQKREVLITGSHDKTAVLWSVRSLEPSFTLPHVGVVLATELSDCATTAFTGAGDGLVRVWRVSSGECVRTVGERGGLPVTCLSWSKGWLAWSCGRVVLVWDTHLWRKKCELSEHEDRVECVQLKINDVASGRGLVITSSRDTTVRYWTSASGRLVARLAGHLATVNSVSSNSWAIASGSDDSSLKIWNFHAYHHHHHHHHHHHPPPS